jgi:hypothetical protein
MNRCKLQRQLAAILAAAERAEEKVIAEARAKYVVPFCDRTGYSLSAGMGSWSFHKGDRTISSFDAEDQLPARVYAVMTAATINRSQDAGSLMACYTPKGVR